MEINETQKKIQDNYEAMKELQLDKNLKYGNAGLEPIGIFAQSKYFDGNEAKIGLLFRLDDKLNRIKNAPELRVNDICDLMGYLNLLLISKGTTKEDILALKD